MSDRCIVTINWLPGLVKIEGSEVAYAKAKEAVELSIEGEGNWEKELEGGAETPKGKKLSGRKEGEPRKRTRLVVKTVVW